MKLKTPKNYWMLTMTPEIYTEVKTQGFKFLFMSKTSSKKLKRITNGDRFICYILHERNFQATATAISSYSTNTIKKETLKTFPFLIEAKKNITLTEKEAINAGILAPRLDFTKKWFPEDWPMAFLGNLHLISKLDFLLIETEFKRVKQFK